MTLTWPDPVTPPAGDPHRFGRRWRLVGAGLSNVWRYGDLDLNAPFGRLLLRGPNGTGKTTVLELVWPYLLDLNPQLLAAGRSRNTHLSNRMSEGADGRRRVGYVWMSFGGPGAGDVVSYGVRLNFSEGGSPPVQVDPFSVPGRPLHEFALWGPGRATLTHDQFKAAVSDAGGVLFDDEGAYVHDLATRIFGVEPRELPTLAARIRQVRNPALLQAMGHDKAAEALRESLPGVAEDVIVDTGEALAESDATRQAFEGDRTAATLLAEFARVWTGHAADVAGTHADRAVDAAGDLRARDEEHARLGRAHETAVADATKADTEHVALTTEHAGVTERLRVLEHSEAYEAAGRLGDLARLADQQAETAEARWGTLDRAAASSRRQASEDAHAAGELAADVAREVVAAASFEPAVAGLSFLASAQASRPPFRVGDRTADAGAVVTATVDTASLDGAVAALAAAAGERTSRSDRAALHAAAHAPVARAEVSAEEARREAGRLGATANDRATTENKRQLEAVAAAAALGERVAAWFATAALPEDWSDVADLVDVTDFDWSQPAEALATAEGLGDAVASWAHQSAAASNAQADAAAARAAALRVEANDLRVEASRIRDDGVLLPLPRPGWAGAGDDAFAFGAAVDWVDGTSAELQDAVEATLAAAGVLGATLTATGAETLAWAVDAHGAVSSENLASILVVDPAHPLADVAAAVLARITLVDSAVAVGGDTHVGLVVGRDGTFRAGVTVAAVPDAQDPQLRRPATHVGAQRRRANALAHADSLDARAELLDEEAGTEDTVEHDARAAAKSVLAALAGFPKAEQLRRAESSRAAAATEAYAASQAAAAAEREAERLTAEAGDARRAWSAAVIDAGLTPDIAVLTELVTTDREAAKSLRTVAGRLDDHYRSRLRRFADLVVAHDESTALAALHAEAVSAFDDAERARVAHEELRASAGQTVEDALTRHAELTGRLGALRPKVHAASERVRAAESKVTELSVRVEEAARRVAEAAPVAAQRTAELRALLALPGVAAAVLGADVEPDDQALLDQVTASLAGKATSGRRALRTLFDETRSKLAGVWAFDPGPDHPELSTFVLTHGIASYPPVAAAAHAAEVAAKAERALRAADETALREFVIGRLPAAIAEAWTRLFDWSRDVNAKMKTASASSGVGVAVKITARKGLPPVTQTVYELVCGTGDALRNAQARTKAGQALNQLIHAADGDDMAARVRRAVNIRDWVDVSYEVTRPNQPPRKWGRGTGLSNGEARLVVLAPMLAAVAAAYDKFPETALRLAALDEVPSDVDEAGREGLARYIASLDLDLLATSHGWDGAPGAWDGIDAFDLEAAPDGTVVAFPMLIRSFDDDAASNGHSNGAVNGHAVPPV